MNDGCETIFLSTRGENDAEVSEALVQFLKFAKEDLEGSQQDFQDEFVKRIQKSVHDVKASREMRGRYMIFEEMMHEGRLEKAREDILELLEDFGEIPEDFQKALEKETDESRLKVIHKAAARSDSMEEFMDKIRDIWN